MNIIKKIGIWFKELFEPNVLLGKQEKHIKKVEPPVVFSIINFAEKPPKNEEVIEHQLYFVVSGNKPKWSLFKCPCRCGDVITLSLQPMHRPHWRLAQTESGRATLHPSVWRDKGCMSHFWLKDGRIYWCHDTGVTPYSRNTVF